MSTAEKGIKDNWAERDKELRRRQFEAMAEDFIQRWAPQDRYEASQFSAQLFGIIRMVAIEMSEASGKQFSDLIRAMPMPPFGGKSVSDK